MPYEKMETIAFAESVKEAVHFLDLKLDPDKQVFFNSSYNNITEIIITRRSFDDGNPYQQYMINATFVVKDDDI